MKTKSAAGALQKRDFGFDIKGVDDAGTFTGYGSVFGVVDSYGEVVASGAFAKSLQARAAKGRPLPVLWQHRSGEPIGVFDVAREDSVGLFMKGRLLVDDVARAKEAHALMKAGAISGLSIGYYVMADSWNEKEKVRTLTEVDLQETSIVTFPANDAARVEQVKSAVTRILKAGNMPTLAEFEDFLCEAGFSNSQAKAVTGHGLRKLLDRREVDGSTSRAALQLLSDFRL